MAERSRSQEIRAQRRDIPNVSRGDNVILTWVVVQPIVLRCVNAFDRNPVLREQSSLDAATVCARSWIGSQGQAAARRVVSNWSDEASQTLDEKVRIGVVQTLKRGNARGRRDC